MTKINLHFTGFMFGVGAHIDDVESLQKINRLKERESDKSFIVLLPNLEELPRFTRVSRRLQIFLTQFWPGALTVILRCSALPHLAQDGFVGFRVPCDERLRELLLGGAMVSTSVNRSGETALQCYEQIMAKFGHWFDADWVPKDVREAAGTPSTLVRIDGAKLTCLREGLLDFERVQEAWNALA